MIASLHYTFTALIWQYNSTNGWYFVTLPVAMSEEIRTHLKWQEEGWGRLKAEAKIANYPWKTAIWFDTKQNAYLLPLKAEVRTQCKLEKGQVITVDLFL